MKSWILNIVGIVFIGVIIEIILPDGKSNTFIKHIFNIFMSKRVHFEEKCKIASAIAMSRGLVILILSGLPCGKAMDVNPAASITDASSVNVG